MWGMSVLVRVYWGENRFASLSRGGGGHKEALTCLEWGGLQNVLDLRAPLHIIDNQTLRLVGLFVQRSIP